MCAGKTSNSCAYLARYELADRSTGNIQVFINTEDDWTGSIREELRTGT